MIGCWTQESKHTFAQEVPCEIFFEFWNFRNNIDNMAFCLKVCDTSMENKTQEFDTICSFSFHFALFFFLV